MRDEIREFEEKGVRPFGVNPASVDAHAKYVRKFEFNFPLLSDPDRAIATAYQALKDDGRGIQRTVYLIGMDGLVRFGVRGAPPTAEILAALGG